MSIVDLILLLLVAVLLFLAIRYTVKKTKSGGCVGCGESGCCGGSCSCCHAQKKK